MNIMRLNIYCLIATLAITAWPLAAANAAKLYKWVDENGRIHYSDKMPPEIVRKEHSVLNDSGLAIKTVEPPKSEEEIAAEQRRAEEEEKRRTEEAALATAQAKKDRVLLDTFLSEKDMIRARDSRVAALDNSIQLSQTQSNRLELRLADLEKEHALHQSRGNTKMAEQVARQIADTKNMIVENKSYIRSQETEKARIIDKFNADIKRFRELKSESQ